MNPEEEDIVTEADATASGPPAAQPPRPPAFTSLLKHAAVYGGTGGAIAAVWMIADYSLGFQTEHPEIGRFTGLAMFVVPIITFVLGVMRWRDRALGGVIKFAQAFGTALAVGTFFALATAMGAWLQAAVISPDFIPHRIDMIAAAMAEAGKNATEIEKWRQEVTETATPVNYGRQIFALSLVISLVLSLMVALMVRRKPDACPR